MMLEFLPEIQLIIEGKEKKKRALKDAKRLWMTVE
jgi:hypothetical protein